MEELPMKHALKPFVFNGALRTLTLSLIALAALALLSQPAAAQATYQYTGHPFTLFSCGPFVDSTTGLTTGTLDCSTPAPTNGLTSYTATDFVSATLNLDAALPANMAIQDVRTFAGFHLSLNDGQHTVTEADQHGMFAEVATDASGQVSQWRLVINTGGTQNGGIATVNKGTSVFDSGTIACCDPTVPGNLALNLSMPGTWSGGTPSPTSAVTSLVNMLSNPLLQLTPGQISSFTDKLNNVLASIQSGQNKQAINQLSAFVNSVQSSWKTGKMSTQTATTLTDAAQAISAMLN